MNLTFVSVENNISTLGFRKMTGLVRSIHPDVKICYIVPIRTAAPLQRLAGTPEDRVADDEIDTIAMHLAKSDMVCFSSMSTHAEYTKKLIASIRSKNPTTFIMWGGIHCIMDPEDSIRHADAICTGEGERAFPEFFDAFKEGRDYSDVHNCYFNRNGKIIRNGLRPLLTRSELETLPFPTYAEQEMIFDPKQGFIPLTAKDYVRFEGLQYNVLWSIGCPNKCVYCGNSQFLKMHRDYARLRYPSVDYLIEQITRARESHPHISAVTFQDDSFMAMPRQVLEEFADKWKQKVQLPFAVHGLIPRYVRSDKMKMLISAGMIRVRMGIQSGSPRTLKFYKRPDTVEAITRALRVIGDHASYMMTPSYDFIVDNPVETAEDSAATVRLLQELPRPFILNIYPLMVIPGTELEEISERENLKLPFINPGKPTPSLINVLIVLSALIKLPKQYIERMLTKVVQQETIPTTYPIVLKALKGMFVFKRALLHLKAGNLSVVPSTMVLMLWRTGIVSLLNKRMLKKCYSVDSAPAEKPITQTVLNPD